MEPGQTDSTPDALDRALQAVVGWLLQRRLKLNPMKKEILYLSHEGLGAEVWLPAVDCGATVKCLGAILHASLSMEAQISAARSAFYHLYLVRYLTSWDFGTVIHAAVTSRQDYCNSLYMGLPLNLTCKLQLVQNVVVHALTATSVLSCIHLVLCHLHWLPIEYWIWF